MLRAKTVKKLLFRPFQQFFRLQSASGILLLSATMIALMLANSPWEEGFTRFWHTTLTLKLGNFGLSESLHFWINDALMAVFFLVVGLEIKRELLIGELSSFRKASLPILAAIGGMVVPALIYWLFNYSHPDALPGWGIPTVTDIAFALGALQILGNRVPLSLKVFLTALAIADDVGAILLIALFYSGGIVWPYVGLMAFILLTLFALNRWHIIRLLPYILLGIALWGATLLSGLHATIAGVLLAFAIPARARVNPCRFQDEAQAALAQFQNTETCDENALMLTTDEQQASVQALENLCEEVQSPLQQMEHELHPWVSFVILPLFAFANAGIHFTPGSFVSAITHPIGLGIMAGLFLGKQIGITFFSWLSVRLGWAELPAGVSWAAIYGASILGGIGFTMSLFISFLAFEQFQHLLVAKTGILAASLISSAFGILILGKVLKPQVEPVGSSS